MRKFPIMLCDSTLNSPPRQKRRSERKKRGGKSDSVKVNGSDSLTHHRPRDGEGGLKKRGKDWGGRKNDWRLCGKREEELGKYELVCEDADRQKEKH